MEDFPFCFLSQELCWLVFRLFLALGHQGIKYL